MRFLFILHIICYYAIPQYLWVKSPNSYAIPDPLSFLFFAVLVCAFAALAYKELYGKTKKILFAFVPYTINLVLLLLVFRADIETTLLLHGGTSVIGVLIAFAYMSFEQKKTSIMGFLLIGGLYLAAYIAVMVEVVSLSAPDTATWLAFVSIIFSCFTVFRTHLLLFKQW